VSDVAHGPLVFIVSPSNDTTVVKITDSLLNDLPPRLNMTLYILVSYRQSLDE
jgi:hypothetical protein